MDQYYHVFTGCDSDTQGVEKYLASDNCENELCFWCFLSPLNLYEKRTKQKKRLYMRFCSVLSAREGEKTRKWTQLNWNNRRL